MPAVKYSTTNLPNTIRVNNVALGINNVSYGPTQTTGFYNTIDVPSNGYCVYRFPNGEGQPNVYVAQNDTELITLAGRKNASTVSEAITFINGLSNTLLLNRNYEDIVTDGLIINLDASMLASYPKDGTTWTDISANSNNGTLINGPTFNTDGGGCIVFDGSNDYVNFGDKNSFTLPGGFSVNIWFKTSSFSGAAPFLAKYESARYEFVFGMVGGNLYGWVYDTTTNAYRGRYATSIATYTSVSTWNNFAYTYDGGGLTSSSKLYINGVQRDNTDFANANTFVTIRNTSSLLNLGNYNIGLGGPINGRVGLINYYNRPLTITEILQNYNSTKTRFGL